MTEILEKTGRYPLEISVFLEQLKKYENQTATEQKIIDKAYNEYRFYRLNDIDKSHNKFISENINNEDKKQQFLVNIFQMDRGIPINDLKLEMIDHNLSVFNFEEKTLASISPLAKEYLLTKYPIQSLSLKSILNIMDVLKILIHDRKGIPKGYDFEYYFRLAVLYSVDNKKTLSFNFSFYNSEKKMREKELFNEKFEATKGFMDWKDIADFVLNRFEKNVVLFPDRSNLKFIDGVIMTLKEKNAKIYFYDCSIDKNKKFVEIKTNIWNSNEFIKIKQSFEIRGMIVEFYFVAVVSDAENLKNINESEILIMESRENQNLFMNLKL